MTGVVVHASSISLKAAAHWRPTSRMVFAPGPAAHAGSSTWRRPRRGTDGAANGPSRGFIPPLNPVPSDPRSGARPIGQYLKGVTAIWLTSRNRPENACSGIFFRDPEAPPKAKWLRQRPKRRLSKWLSSSCLHNQVHQTAWVPPIVAGPIPLKARLWVQMFGCAR